ncbi:MAG: hypothetical protein LBH34_06245 [Prevotellaceae bacterium]|jgi:hypothetical protein|nr:hypothetical protein [Prevotellaceae bacterium]
MCNCAEQLAEMPIIVQIDKIEDENKPFNETIDIISKWLLMKMLVFQKKRE